MKSYRMNLLVLFRLRYNKKDKSRPAYLYCRITFDGIEARPDFSTKVKVDPKTWDSKKQVIEGSDHATANNNDSLAVMRNNIIDIAKRLIYLNQPVSASIIKDVFLGKTKDHHTFLEVFQEYIKMKTKLIGKDVEKRTVDSYQTRYNNVSKFLKSINRIEMHPSDFKETVAESFVYYLMTEENCCKDYAMKNVQVLKHILKIAVKKEYIDKNPLAHFEFKFNRRKPIIFLDHDQLKYLENHRFAQHRLQQVADVFLFGCYTGLSYIELKRFCYDEHIVKLKENEPWIIMARKKSLEPFAVPLHKKPAKILEKYSNRLPVISNAKYNSYLKEVADIIGFTKKLTTHVARKTCGFILINSGVPVEVVAKVLGHADIRTTLKQYAEIDLKTVGRELEKVNLQ